jgi:RNA polymerase sigma-70 factor (ECF subfamily)
MTGVEGADPAEVADADLIAALRHDPDALEEFYRRHVTVVTRFAQRRLGDPHQADDIVAAAFLAVIDSADRYEPDRGSTRAWLFGITSNLIAGANRRAAAEYRAVQRLGGQRPLWTDELAGLEEAIDARRRVGSPGAMLDLLPTAERELVTLLLDRHTLPEAADVLGIRTGTARMRLARARARLARHLQPHEGDFR